MKTYMLFGQDSAGNWKFLDLQDLHEHEKPKKCLRGLIDIYSRRFPLCCEFRLVKTKVAAADYRVDQEHKEEVLFD